VGRRHTYRYKRTSHGASKNFCFFNCLALTSLPELIMVNGKIQFRLKKLDLLGGFLAFMSRLQRI
jgi:hypothetical protein